MPAFSAEQPRNELVVDLPDLDGLHQCSPHRVSANTDKSIAVTSKPGTERASTDLAIVPSPGPTRATAEGRSMDDADIVGRTPALDEGRYLDRRPAGLKTSFAYPFQLSFVSLPAS
jgi:hypothetical protein